MISRSSHELDSGRPGQPALAADTAHAHLGVMEGTMVFLSFLVLAIYAFGRFFPDSKPGRLIRDVLAGRWRNALPYLIVVAGVVLLLLSAPELAPLAAGLDLSLMADMLLAASIVLVQLNIRRLRLVGRYFGHMVVRAMRPAPRPRRRRTTRRPRPPRADDDAPWPAMDWLDRVAPIRA